MVEQIETQAIVTETQPAFPDLAGLDHLTIGFAALARTQLRPTEDWVDKRIVVRFADGFALTLTEVGSTREDGEDRFLHDPVEIARTAHPGPRSACSSGSVTVNLSAGKIYNLEVKFYHWSGIKCQRVRTCCPLLWCTCCPAASPACLPHSRQRVMPSLTQHRHCRFRLGARLVHRHASRRLFRMCRC